MRTESNLQSCPYNVHFRCFFTVSYLLGPSLLALLARRTRRYVMPEPARGSDGLEDRIIVLLSWVVSSSCSSRPTSKVESRWMETGALQGVLGNGYISSWCRTSCRPGGQWDGTEHSLPEPGFTGEMANFLLIGILGAVSDVCASPWVTPEKRTTMN